MGPTTRAVDVRLDGVKKELKTILDKAEQEAKSRLESMHKEMRSNFEQQETKQSETLEASRRTLETRTVEMREQASKLNERVSKIEKEMKAYIDRSLEAVRDDLRREVAQLRGELIDRESMAGVFSELALRIGGDVQASIDPSTADAELEALIDQRTRR